VKKLEKTKKRSERKEKESETSSPRCQEAKASGKETKK